MEDKDQEQVQPIKVDLDTMDSSLVEENIEINPDANPMDSPPPIDDGVHRVKLILDPDWSMAETKPNKEGNKTTFYKCKISGQVVSEDKNNNRRVFANLNTLTFDGKNQMVWIMMQILGGNKNEQARSFVAGLKSQLEIAKAFKEALSGEPIIKVKTKWSAQYNAGTKEKADYKTALSGQQNFPKNPDGTYKHVVNVRGFGEVAARANIEDYFPD